MRLIDKIARYGLEHYPTVETQSQAPRIDPMCVARDALEAQVIVVDNVAAYVETLAENHVFSLAPYTTDFPNLAPPFRSMFFEWREATDFSAGVLIHAQSYAELAATQDETADARLRAHGLDETFKREMPKLALQGGWVMNTIGIIAPSAQKRPIFLPAQTTLQIDADGQLRVQPLATFYTTDKGFMDSWQDFSGGNLLPIVMLALSFMHCRNVAMKPGAAIPTALQRKAIKKHGRPFIKYHVLEIEPIKRMLQNAKANATGAGAGQTPLHICRGHFKDYRQSGLFGKVKGIFWWDQYVRGDAENGTVVKDYNVHPA